MPRQAHATLTALLLSTLLAAAGPAFAARSDWREMTVGHFHLYSTLRDGRTRDIARQLQMFEQTVGKLLQTDDGLPDVPTLIYILGDQDFRKYAVDRPGAGGFFHEGIASNLLVIDGDADFDWVKVAVFHEYTHFIQRNTHTARLPPWYVEGYAEIFSASRIENGVVTLGELPNNVHVSMDPREWIPMERLLAVKWTDPEYRAEKLMPQFYGESWVLVHLLMFDDRTLLVPTDNYLTDMDLGLPEPAAFSKYMPFDKPGLDEALKKLIRGRVIHLRKLTLRNPVEVDQAPITRMTVAEADAAMARLLFTLGRPPAVVDPVMQAAVAESPSAPAVLALATRVAARTHDRLDLEVARRLAAETNLTTQERIDLADALILNGGTVETCRLARTLLDAVVRAPDAPIEAVLIWTDAAQHADVSSATVIEVLEPASKRAPHNTALLQWLAISNEARGAKARARDLYTRIMVVSYSDQERLWAQQQADSERLQDDPPPAAPVRTDAPPARPPAKRPARP